MTRLSALALATLLAGSGASMALAQKAKDDEKKPAEESLASKIEKLYDRAVFHETVEGDLARAVAAYRELLATNGVSTELQFRGRSRMAACLRRLGRAEEADAELATLVRLFPDRARTVAADAERGSGGSGVEGRAWILIERLGSTDKTTVTRAQGDLRWFGEAVVPFLEKALRGENHDRTKNAAEALFDMNKASASDVLIRAIGDEDTILRRSVMQVISNKANGSRSRFFDPFTPYAEAFRERLESDEEASIRHSALRLLRFADPDWLIANARKLTRDDDPVIRSSTIHQIKEIHRKEVREIPHELVNDLSFRMTEDEDVNVRSSAISLAVEALPVPLATNCLAQVMGDPSVNVRMSVVRYLAHPLGEKGGKYRDGLLDLASRMATDRDASVLRELARTLSRLIPMASPPAVGRSMTAITPVFEKFRLEDRREILRVLTKNPHEAAQDLVLAAFVDPDTCATAADFIAQAWNKDWASPVPAVLDVIERRVPNMATNDGRGASFNNSAGIAFNRCKDTLETHGTAETIPQLIALYPKLMVGRTKMDDAADAVINALYRLLMDHVADTTSSDWIGSYEVFSGVRSVIPRLSKILDESGRPELIEAREYYVRRTPDTIFNLTGRLARAGNAEARESLLRLATDKSLTPELRFTAASGLSRTPGIESRGFELCEALAMELNGKDDEESESVAIDIVRYLAGDADANASTRRLWEAKVHRLATLQGWDRGQTVPMLMEIVDRDILAKAFVDKSPHVRSTALKIAGSLQEMAFAEAARQAVSDPEPMVRSAAAIALGSLRDADAVPVLVELLRDVAPQVRTHAKKSLEQIRFYVEQKGWWDDWRMTGGSRSAVGGVIAMLEDPDRDVRMRAIASLGSLRAPEALPVLLRLMKSDDEGVRKAATEAVDRINESK